MINYGCLPIYPVRALRDDEIKALTMGGSGVNLSEHHLEVIARLMKCLLSTSCY